MSARRKPPKPHPECVWDEKNGIWLWPDDRTAEQREADELAEKAAMEDNWEKYGFRHTRSARVNPPGKRRRQKARS